MLDESRVQLVDGYTFFSGAMVFLVIFFAVLIVGYFVRGQRQEVNRPTNTELEDEIFFDKIEEFRNDFS